MRATLLARESLDSMIRDVDRLTARTFDLLVVGGGIYGLTIACDAAQRGLSVALIEAVDFGSGSSFNHLRTIHGGLRYLQTLDVTRARESVRERRTLARIAPYALRPLPFVLPLTRSLTRGPLAMQAGFLLDRVVSRDRNDEVPEALQLPAGRVLSRAEAVGLCPDLASSDLTAAALWYDYTTTEPDRLTFAWAVAADGYGATLANYVEALALRVDDRRVVGVRAMDRQGGRELEIAARVTVNATGGQIERLLSGPNLTMGLPMLKAMNLVTGLEPGECAVGGRSRAGRNFFRVPWRGRALFGTWESSRAVAATETQATASEVAAFLAELNDAFPSLQLGRADVTLVHRGVVPAVAHPSGGVALEGHEQIRDHAESSRVEGLLSVAGTKYTTARAVAERVTDQIVRKLQISPVRCRTAETPLPDWRKRLSSDSPGMDAELVYAARHEMAVTLVDALVRRTPIGALGHPGDRVASHAAVAMAGELGWPAEQTARELEALTRFYAIE